MRWPAVLAILVGCVQPAPVPVHVASPVGVTSARPVRPARPAGPDSPCARALPMVADERPDGALIERVLVDRGATDDVALRRLRRLAGTVFEPARALRMAEVTRSEYAAAGYRDAAIVLSRAELPGLGLCVAVHLGEQIGEPPAAPADEDIAIRDYDDAALVSYVTAVAARVARAAGADRGFDIRILDDPDPAAQVGPAGTLLVTRGALARLRDEAELAALLGHEIGHVVAGHDRDLVIHRDARSRRDDEIQADELAVLFVARAGYDPRAVETMLRAIASGASADDYDDSGETHPQPSERIARVHALAALHPGGERPADELRAHLAGLVVGTDRRSAAVVRSALVFGRARVAVDFPAGWTRVDALEDRGAIDLGDSTHAELRVMPLALAAGLVTRDPGGDAVDWYTTQDTAIVTRVTGANAAATAHRIHAAMRDATAAELADLAPVQLDWSHPRKVWPEVSELAWDLGTTWATNDHGVVELHRLSP